MYKDLYKFGLKTSTESELNEIKHKVRSEGEVIPMHN
jgi:hypothetical protein